MSRTALNDLISVSESYDVNWDENSMLALACQYLDSLDLDESFFYYLVGIAESEANYKSDLE